jgi:hypothetical protein
MDTQQLWCICRPQLHTMFDELFREAFVTARLQRVPQKEGPV